MAAGHPARQAGGGRGMTDKMNISVQALDLMIKYEPTTGCLFWKKRPRQTFDTDFAWKAWNGRYAGKQAGSASARKYLYVKIQKRCLLAHRVAWALHYGEWPSQCIDHINGNRQDNRLENLRSVSEKENNKNLSIRSDNKSGVVGVRWLDNRRKWYADIRVSKKLLHLGYFETKAEAVAARKQAETKFGFHSNHGKTQ